MEDNHIDKDWARRYILDPLTDPEPNQETGPGSSHCRASSFLRPPTPVSHPNRPFAVSTESLPDCSLGTLSLEPSRSQPSPHFDEDVATTTPIANTAANVQQRNMSPASIPSGPSGSGGRNSCAYGDCSTPPDSAGPSSLLQSTSHSGASSSFTSSTPPSCQPRPSFESCRPIVESYLTPFYLTPPDSPMYEPFGRKFSHPRDGTHGGLFHPDGTPRLRRLRGLSDVDTIDSLDNTPSGGAYHHSGPFDAASMSRNPHWESSPLAAVHDSNMEALRATPSEYIIDSVEHGAPLQGTAIVPPGTRDRKGKEVAYAEGDDLMREPDAPGGAYKRYDDVDYHPADLKGKGEPSFSVEHKGRQVCRLRGLVHLSSPYIDDDNGNASSSREPRVHEIDLDSDPDKRSFRAGDDERDFHVVWPPRDSVDGPPRHFTGRRISEGLRRGLKSFRRGKNRLFSRRGRAQRPRSEWDDTCAVN